MITTDFFVRDNFVNVSIKSRTLFIFLFFFKLFIFFDEILQPVSFNPKRISLINDYVSKDELRNSVKDLAIKIANKAPMTVRNGKAAFYKQSEMSLKDAYDYTGAVMAENMMFEQTKKGINLFLDKKTPEWDQ